LAHSIESVPKGKDLHCELVFSTVGIYRQLPACRLPLTEYKDQSAKAQLEGNVAKIEEKERISRELDIAQAEKAAALHYLHAAEKAA